MMCYFKKTTARLLFFTLICATLASVLFCSVYAAEDKKTVKVGYMLLENFEDEQIITQNGREVVVRSGYGYEYLQMLRYYTGWEYEYVTGTWDGLLLQLENGQIDILSHVAKTPEREGKFLFSAEPQGSDSHYLYVDGPNEAIDPLDYSTLNGKNVGVIKGDFRTQHFLQWCQKHDVSCNIKEYKDITEIHTAIHSGEIQATSASSTVISSFPDGKWRAVIRFEDTPVYFAVKNGKEGEELIAEINHAQKRIFEINDNYGTQLMQKYSSGYQTHTPLLTEEEKAWLKEHGEIVVGYCDDRRPLSYTDEKTGEMKGLLADYLKAITEKYGIEFKTKKYKTGEQMLSALNSGEVDVISPVGYQTGMAEIYDIAITNPITTETMVAVYKGYKGVAPKDIFEKIAILGNSITEKDYAKRFYPNAEWQIADSIKEAINFVAEDKASCYIIRSSTWSWYKNEYPVLNELHVLTLPDTNDVNMAIQNENIRLLPILNKGISLLSASDVNQSIVAHSDPREKLTWLAFAKENPAATAMGVIAVVLVFVLVFVIYRLRTEKKYLAQLKRAKDEAENARNEAEKANQAKSVFLTSMSHDIRTPMNAIVGMTTLAGKHISNTDYVKNCLNKVTLASEHLLTLINDVLDINKIESGNLSLNPTIFSIADCMMNLSNLGRQQIQDKNHQFEIRVHDIKYEYLFADELRISQIFINLLSNAIKYTPTGGCITIDLKQEQIKDDPGKVKLIYIIQDTGIGMTEEFQKHMYELFTMANRNSSKVIGSGVGLSICKQLVELMDGRIECESEVNKGTTFTVTIELPIADKAVDEIMLPAMKLLLVDDDEVFLATASETLKEIGLSPDCVNSGEKAIETVKIKHSQANDYPLIIIDWCMPGMDGIETTKEIRKTVGEDVSIIIISAYAPEDIRDVAIEAGASGFIHKPFFKSVAYRSISEVLGVAKLEEDAVSDTHKKVSGMNLLVAEDNDLNWEIAKELLNMYGVTTVRAENGKECLDILAHSKQGEYNAVLMDIQMPVMNGYEATEQIRNSKQAHIRSIPVIAMTADAYAEDVLKCVEAGMNAHIPKPIDMDKLLDVLASLE